MGVDVFMADRVVFGRCFCGVKGKGRGKVVFEAVDSLILCPSCRHFHCSSVHKCDFRQCGSLCRRLFRGLIS